MKEADGILSIDVDLLCPHCDETFNLADQDGSIEILSKIVGSGIDGTALNEGVDCPECGVPFMIKHIIW